MYSMVLLYLLFISQTFGDDTFGEWGRWGSCSKTCGGGTRSRKRLCNPPTVRDCDGEVQTMNCVNDFCPGLLGVAKMQELIAQILQNFYHAKYPVKRPSGKFYQSIFHIQKAAAEEFISADPSATGETAEERLMELEDLFKIATEGGSINFARRTLGKTLYRFMKKEIKGGSPLDDINKAASGYLDTLEREVGEKVWSQVLASQGDSTLMFTMDTTGSMADEIRASKDIARSIIEKKRDFEVDYILSPFNDPKTGPVTYKSQKDRAGFITDIENLTAKGGGDCAELAFQGMLDALAKGPHFGSPMFVFTDASAKDDTEANMVALKEVADMNSATITFFTNLRGCSRKGIKSYNEIAKATSGQVLPLKGENELVELKDYVDKRLRKHSALASGGSLTDYVDKKLRKHSAFESGGSLTGRRTKRSQEAYDSYSFSVDDGLKSLTIPVALSKLKKASEVVLIDPWNNTVYANNSLSLTRIFEIDNPKAGNWRLIVPRSVGKHKFSVDGVSKDPIEFTHNFIYQEDPSGNSPPISLNHPIKGQKNMLIVRLGDVHRIDVDTLRVSLLDNSGTVLKSDVQLSKLDSDQVYSANVTPPNTSFQVKLTGKTINGSSFERISRGVSRATKLFFRPVYIGKAFTVNLGEQADLLMQFLNFGSEALFTFRGAARYGDISSTKTESIRRIGFVKLTYDAPSGLKTGSIDWLTVAAVNKATGEKKIVVFTVLLV